MVKSQETRLRLQKVGYVFRFPLFFFIFQRLCSLVVTRFFFPTETTNMVFSSHIHFPTRVCVRVCPNKIRHTGVDFRACVVRTPSFSCKAQDKTRQHNRRQHNRRQHNRRQQKTTQHKTTEDKRRRKKTRQAKTRQKEALSLTYW